jgi:hypothetical protein
MEWLKLKMLIFKIWMECEKNVLHELGIGRLKSESSIKQYAGNRNAGSD